MNTTRHLFSTEPKSSRRLPGLRLGDDDAVTYNQWDAATGKWKRVHATFNPATGRYDLNVTETDLVS